MLRIGNLESPKMKKAPARPWEVPPEKSGKNQPMFYRNSNNKA